MLSKPSEIKDFSNEVFGRMTREMDLKLSPPTLDIKPLDKRIDYAFRKMRREEKALQQECKRLSMAFGIDLPSKDTIRLNAANVVARNILFADYNSLQDIVRISFCPSAKSYEEFNKKLNVEPWEVGEGDVEEHSDELPSSIAGEIGKSIRRKAYNMKPSSDGMIIADKGKGVLDVRSLDSLESIPYIDRMRDGKFKLIGIVDIEDVVSEIGIHEGAILLEGTKHAYEPTCNHEKLTGLLETVERYKRLERTFNIKDGHSIYWTVMSDICGNMYASQQDRFRKEHVYNKSDPIMKRSADDIFAYFLDPASEMLRR